MSKRLTKRLVREGAYIAEVDVTLTETEHEWAPYVSPEDVRKLDEVRTRSPQGRSRGRGSACACL